jgi:hypothetical protein
MFLLSLGLCWRISSLVGSQPAPIGPPPLRVFRIGIQIDSSISTGGTGPMPKHIQRLHEKFKRRIKTQTVLPSVDTAAMLFWALLASGQIKMRKADARHKTHRSAN